MAMILGGESFKKLLFAIWEITLAGESKIPLNSYQL